MHGTPSQVERRDPEPADRGRLGEHRRQPLVAARALHGEHRPRRRWSSGRRRWRARDPVGVRRVGHHVEALVVDPPHDDVVEHRRVGLVEQVGVLGPARADLAEVVGQRPLQPVDGVGALDPHGAEVADVEDDGVVPAGPVLGERAGRVGQRHVPAAERHHLGARGRGGRRRAGCARTRPARRPSARPGGAARRFAAAVARRRAASSCDRGRARPSRPPRASTLTSTPWPARFITSISSSPSQTITSLPLITRWAAAMSVAHVLAHVGERLAHRLQLDAGVEQALDHPQLEQVLVAVPPAAAAAGWRRPATGAPDRCGPSSRAGGR